jgi:hypothetical protein
VLVLVGLRAHGARSARLEEVLLLLRARSCAVVDPQSLREPGLLTGFGAVVKLAQRDVRCVWFDVFVYWRIF